MKIYISADMEGVSGVVHREQTSPQGVDYERARRLMTAEVNAAVQAALDMGATDVLVSDSHGANGFRNILIEELHPRAELITGGPRALGQLEGLDESFSMVVLLGYHARHGAEGVLDHTTHGQAVHRLVLNGVEVGEIGLNAALAGHFGVPIGVVSGDDQTVREAQLLLPWVKGAVVKWKISRYAARCLSCKEAHLKIREAIMEAVKEKSKLRPYIVKTPVEIKISFKDTGSVYSALRIPGAKQIDSLTVEFTCHNMLEAYQCYSAVVDLWQPAWGYWIRSGS